MATLCRPLSLSSQRYALMQIGSMYTWMVKGGRLKGNPVALVRKPQAPHDPTIKRLLPEEGIALAFEAINLTKSPRKRARDHFMLSLFYLTGVRTFEGTTSNMSSIHRSASGTWWLNVLGKRNKIRDVPISDELYQDLQLYREAFGLPRDIPSKDPTPPPGRQLQTQAGAYQHRAQSHHRDHDPGGRPGRSARAI